MEHLKLFTKIKVFCSIEKSKKSIIFFNKIKFIPSYFYSIIMSINANNKYRTALCKYHQANIKCPFESCCLYPHGPYQLLRLFKTPLKSTISSH